MSDGRVRRAYLGIAGAPRPLPPAEAARRGTSDTVEIVEVVTGSPAEAAGLRAGDLLVELAGRPVVGVSAVQRAMQEDVIGTRLPVRFLRDGHERTAVVVPVELTG
jgi:S1-C subfamily serine protease